MKRTGLSIPSLLAFAIFFLAFNAQVQAQNFFEVFQVEGTDLLFYKEATSAAGRAYFIDQDCSVPLGGAYLGSSLKPGTGAAPTETRRCSLPLDLHPEVYDPLNIPCLALEAFGANRAPLTKLDGQPFGVFLHCLQLFTPDDYLLGVINAQGQTIYLRLIGLI